MTNLKNYIEISDYVSFLSKSNFRIKYPVLFLMEDKR